MPIRQVVPYAPPDQQLVLSGVMVQPFTVPFAMSSGIDEGLAPSLPDDLTRVLSPDDVRMFLNNTFPACSLHDQQADRNVINYRCILHGRDVSDDEISLGVINYQNDYRSALANDYIG